MTRVLMVIGLATVLESIPARADDRDAQAAARLREVGARVTVRDGVVTGVVFWPDSSRAGDADLDCLAGLTGLRTVILLDRTIGDAGLARLAKIPGLQSLTLGGIAVDERGVSTIGGANLTDAGLASIAGMKSIRRLVLAGPKFTDAGLASIGRMTDLTLLGLSSKGFTDAGLAHLVHLPHLDDLNLTDSSVTGPGLVRAGLPRLRSLVVGPGRFEAEALRSLDDLVTLRRLMFYRATLADDLIDRLARMTALETLDFVETPISAARKERLTRALPTTAIDVRGSEIQMMAR